MVCFAWVIRRVDSSPVFGNGCWALRASSRARTASLNTTRAHPNAFANALCWPGSGYSLKAYRSCMTATLHTWVPQRCLLALPAPGGTSRPKAGGEFPDLVRHYWRANKLWSGSYFAGTVGGAPLSMVRQYIEQQNRPA